MAMWAILQLRCGDGSCLVANSCPTLATPSTVAHQASLSMGFSSQDYWSGLPFPSPRDLPDSGIEPRSLALQADSLPTELPGNSAHPPKKNTPLILVRAGDRGNSGVPSQQMAKGNL